MDPKGEDEITQEKPLLVLRRPHIDRRALLEVAVLAGGFILLVQLGLIFVAGSEALRDLFQGREDGVLGGFLIGALIQLMLVGGLYASEERDVKAAVSSLKKRAPAAGWLIALTVAAIEIIFIAGGWLEEPARVFEISKFAVMGSLIPAFDGFSQEVIFRGFILLRLRRAGMEGWLPMVISGLGFALVHIGYGISFGTGLGPMIAALLGTFGLGMVWAWAFQKSNYCLAPVVVSHVLVILILQPWLALSYAG